MCHFQISIVFKSFANPHILFPFTFYGVSFFRNELLQSAMRKGASQASCNYWIRAFFPQHTTRLITEYVPNLHRNEEVCRITYTEQATAMNQRLRGNWAYTVKKETQPLQ